MRKAVGIARNQMHVGSCPCAHIIYTITWDQGLWYFPAMLTRVCDVCMDSSSFFIPVQIETPAS